MAKTSKIAKNEQRKVIVERYAAKRAELKKQLVDPNGSDESPDLCHWVCARSADACPAIEKDGILARLCRRFSTAGIAMPRLVSCG